MGRRRPGSSAQEPDVGDFAGACADNRPWEWLLRVETRHCHSPVMRTSTDLSLSRTVGGAPAEAVRTEANARLISAGATVGE